MAEALVLTKDEERSFWEQRQECLDRIAARRSEYLAAVVELGSMQKQAERLILAGSRPAQKQESVRLELLAIVADELERHLHHRGLNIPR